MAKAKQNLTKRIKRSTNEAERRRLVERLSPKKRKALGNLAIMSTYGETFRRLAE